MTHRARVRFCAQGAQKRAPRTLRFEMLEIRNYLSASPNDLVATPLISIVPDTTTAAIAGYTPAQIASAYGFNGIKFGSTVGNGAGQTIAIVDAYNDPSISLDLHTFDAKFGLADPKLTTVSETGSTKLPAANQGWDMEISLDVEWAHAMAPGASILLVEANSSSLTDLLTSVNYARSQPGVSVVSMSWGASEFSGEQTLDSYFTTPAGHTGVTFVASSGDGGAGANWPAVSPNVVAVGGTSLTITSTGAYSSETAWSGSGGGKSAIYSTPSYQVGVQTTGHRTVPDVSFDANPSTGFAIYDSAGGSKGWMEVGGTSAGSPQWSALIAIADQGRALSKLAPLSGTDTNLYKLPASDFHDVTKGSNGGYSATAGYDEVTGRGSPIANLVVSGLVGSTTTTASTTTTPSTFTLPAKPTTNFGSVFEGGDSGFGTTLATVDFVSISTSRPTIVAATTSVTGTSPPVSATYYDAVAGLGIFTTEGGADGTEQSESRCLSTTTTTTTIDPSVAVESKAAPAVEQADANELSTLALGVNSQAAATPIGSPAAVDACFTEEDFAGQEFIDADAPPAENTVATALALLAGVVIGGWQPVLAADRRGDLTNRNEEEGPEKV